MNDLRTKLLIILIVQAFNYCACYCVYYCVCYCKNRKMLEVFIAMLLYSQPEGSLQLVTRDWHPVGEAVVSTEQDYCNIYLFIFASLQVLSSTFFLL